MWATGSDVQAITGKSVSAAEIERAQYVVSLYAGANPDDDISGSDTYWLKLATAFQAAYHDDYPNRATPGISNISQGDLSVGYDAEADLDVAPKARRALRRVSWLGNRSVQVGTLYRYDYDSEWEAI